MKYELVSVVDMWEELKNSDKSNVWNDDNVFESVSMDEFIDDVNEMKRNKGEKDGWYLSDFENISEIDGEYVERDCE
jgi:hypothetical protein|tara:strand:+ start:164 stop:394 length:231 start_codon:yes stop_codon:yes gene_type:complete